MKITDWLRAARTVATYINQQGGAVSEPVFDYPWVLCKECGERQQATYSEPTKSKMVEYELCFHCLFWTEFVWAKDDPKNVRWRHHHYTIGEEDAKGERGNYGRKYAVYFQGRRVITTNLWHQGEIPERFWDRLPDNCVQLAEVPKGGEI